MPFAPSVKSMGYVDDGMSLISTISSVSVETADFKETKYDTLFPQRSPYENIMKRLEEWYLQGGGSGQVKRDGNTYSEAHLIEYKHKKVDKQALRRLLQAQADASCYKEWYDASLKLDAMLGNETWKQEKESNLYDYQMVENQLREMQQARASHNYRRLVYIVRTGWRRNFAGIDNPELYKHSYVGTKKLIEEYLAECERCLDALVSRDCTLDSHYILQMLTYARKNYGCVAVTMSGGGTFGLSGVGVFATLFEQGISPKVVSGSSCGSIMSAIVCTKHATEILDILKNKVFKKTFEVFTSEAEPESFLTRAGRFLKYGVCFDNQALKETVRDMVGDITFKEAYNKTGKVLNITVSAASVHDQPTLLNYLTAPNVLVWSAICASCSLPLVFPASLIYERDFKTGKINEWSNPMMKFVDGSVNGDLPITRLSEMFNVNHVIACQVNPHILPLIRFYEDAQESSKFSPVRALKETAIGWFKLASSEIAHGLDVLNELGVFPNLCTKFKQVFLQPYSGDITILPDIMFARCMNLLLANPTPDFLWDCVQWGARATWPKVSMMKDHCAIDFSLDSHITYLKSKMISRGSRSTSKEYTLLEGVISEPPAESPRRRHLRRSSTLSLSCYYIDSDKQESPGRRKRRVRNPRRHSDTTK